MSACSRIEIYCGNELLGHFSSHLTPEEAAANIEDEGMGAFADWSGDFEPADKSIWTRDEYDLDWLLNGEQFYRAGDMVGEIAQLPE